MLKRPKPQLDPDGTSQSARRMRALDPDYVSVDERGFEDWLLLARKYTQRLRYYDDRKEESGDWRALLPDSLEDRQIIAFLENPDAFDADAHPLVYRPHFSLFLVFLELLSRARDQLNTVTRRHLDFHYGTVLGLEREPAVPDRVRVLFDLAPGVNEALIEANTALNAGPDSEGLDRHYRTERDLVVNSCKIEQLSSIHVEREVIDFEQARRLYRNDVERTAVELFRIALGEPEPGDPLPEFTEVEGGTAMPVDFALLVRLHDLLKLAHHRLRLRFFELRDLMDWKHRRDAADWKSIYALLERAKDLSFAGLPDVETIDALYEERDRADVQKFITRRRTATVEGLGETLANFERVMAAKIDLDDEWRKIERLLEGVGRERDPSWQLPADAGESSEGSAKGQLAKLLVAAAGQDNLDALPQPDPPVADSAAPLEVFWNRALRIEAGFMYAEAFEYVMWVARKPAAGDGAATPREWEKVDRALTEAHREKLWSKRRDELAQLWDEHGFDGMLRFVLSGEATTAAGKAFQLEELERYLGNHSDLGELRRIAASGPSPSPEDRKRALEIAEVAQRNREGLAPPLPRRQHWLDVYPASDATSLREGSATEAEDLEAWRTFGRPEAGPGATPSSAIGWAVSSPILALAEGNRKITLTVSISPEGVDEKALRLAATKQPFEIEMSTEKGWKALASDQVEITLPRRPAAAPGDDPPLLVVFTLGEMTADFDPIAPLAEGGSPEPAVRLMLRQTRDGDAFRNLYLESVLLEVNVQGLRELTLRNDETLPPALKPFEPFGSAPAVGSRLAIGHPELVAKKLGSLTFRFEWMGAPDDPIAHYENYPPLRGRLGFQTGFTTQVRLVDRGRDLKLHPGAPLFGLTPVEAEQSIKVGFADDLPQGYRYEAAEVDASNEDPTSWRRYFEWELNSPDFQHGTYPSVATAKALEFSHKVATNTLAPSETAASFQVNPPYTPKLKSLRVDYVARIELDVGDSVAERPGGSVLHIHPFGTSEVKRARTAKGIPFLPRYDNEGELLIGLTGVRPPQTVTLFFQMAEGSADPNLPRQKVHWSRLSGDQWVNLDETGQLLGDTTRGLINSGIVELALENSDPSTQLPPQKDGKALYWLRASVGSDSRAICNTVAIHTQAVSAVFEDRGNAHDHFATALPAKSISEFVSRRPEIAAVHQPYTSFGGRRAEEQSLFATRVSERLRHKGRALSMWDYERIVLQAFPEIYKAKCVPGAELGEVDVVVIPDVRTQRPIDPSGPKAPSDLLLDIQRHLAARTPRAASVRVRNPHYVLVKVHVAVRFSTRQNDEFYRRKLNSELNEYLSPWAYEAGADITIGGKIYANSLVDFLDRRDYVDYLANLRLFFSENGKDFEEVIRPKQDAYAVAIERSDAVFIAAPDHEIRPILETGYRRESNIGINFMRLELDFRVASNEGDGAGS